MVRLVRLGDAVKVKANGVVFRPGAYDLRAILMAKVRDGRSQ